MAEIKVGPPATPLETMTARMRAWRFWALASIGYGVILVGVIFYLVQR